jgi:hypothetical protein
MQNFLETGNRITESVGDLISVLGQTFSQIYQKNRYIKISTPNLLSIVIIISKGETANIIGKT